MKVGVIVGRFQVPELTPAHKALIAKVKEENDKVVVFIGMGHLKSSKRYPLPLESVQHMIVESNPDIETEVIYDHQSDEHWSNKLDVLIHDMGYDDDEIVLCGGRDSFIPYYHGCFPTKEILDLGVTSKSGTEVREAVSHPLTSDGRAGAIFATQNQWPSMAQVVDAIIFNKEGKILLCRKEGVRVWQAIGGYVDPDDENLEDAVRREVFEETGLVVDPEYQFSIRIPDYRYEKEDDKMMSHVFLCTIAGNCFEPRAEDDIVEAKFFDRFDLPPISPIHREMFKKLGMGMKERQ